MFFHILLTPCTNFVPFHNFFSGSPPSLCQFYVFLVFTCHNFVMFFHILLTPCANFVPFRNFFSVSPPSLCQFYVFLVFTCHNLVMFFIFYYIATLLEEKTAVIEYNIKSRDRLAKYVSGRRLQLFFHQVYNSSSIREGTLHNP